MKTYIISFIFTGIYLSAAGQTWHRINVNTDKQLNVIDFPTNNTGYIGGNDSLLLKTTDGGKTWQALNPSGSLFASIEEDFADLEFIDEDRGYAITQYMGNGSSLHYTSDGGLSWTLVNDIQLCYEKTIHLFDENNAILGGAGCFTGETIQRMEADNWQTQQLLGDNHGMFVPQYWLEQMDFLDDQFGIAVGYSPHLYITHDGGLTWDTVLINLPTLHLNDVIIVNDTLAYATSSDMINGLLISTDGGYNWKQDLSLITFLYPSFNAIHQSANGFIFAGGRPSLDSSGYTQFYNGEFWNIELVEHRINDIASYGDSITFAIGDSGYVITNVNPVIIGIENKTESGNTLISPNPSNGQFRIQSDMNREMNVTIYDLQGREISSISTNNAQVNIDLSDRPAGMYLVKIRQNGRDRIEKIMITEN